MGQQLSHLQPKVLFQPSSDVDVEYLSVPKSENVILRSMPRVLASAEPRINLQTPCDGAHCGGVLSLSHLSFPSSGGRMSSDVALLHCTSSRKLFPSTCFGIHLACVSPDWMPTRRSLEDESKRQSLPTEGASGSRDALSRSFKGNSSDGSIALEDLDFMAVKPLFALDHTPAKTKGCIARSGSHGQRRRPSKTLLSLASTEDDDIDSVFSDKSHVTNQHQQERFHTYQAQSFADFRRCVRDFQEETIEIGRQRIEELHRNTEPIPAVESCSRSSSWLNEIIHRRTPLGDRIRKNSVQDLLQITADAEISKLTNKTQKKKLQQLSSDHHGCWELLPSKTSKAEEPNFWKDKVTLRSTPKGQCLLQNPSKTSSEPQTILEVGPWTSPIQKSKPALFTQRRKNQHEPAVVIKIDSYENHHPSPTLSSSSCQLDTNLQPIRNVEERRSLRDSTSKGPFLSKITLRRPSNPEKPGPMKSVIIEETVPNSASLLLTKHNQKTKELMNLVDTAPKIVLDEMVKEEPKKAPGMPFNVKLRHVVAENREIKAARPVSMPSFAVLKAANCDDSSISKKEEDSAETGAKAQEVPSGNQPKSILKRRSIENVLFSEKDNEKELKGATSTINKHGPKPQQLISRDTIKKRSSFPSEVNSDHQEDSSKPKSADEKRVSWMEAVAIEETDDSASEASNSKKLKTYLFGENIQKSTTMDIPLGILPAKRVNLQETKENPTSEINSSLDTANIVQKLRSCFEPAPNSTVDVKPSSKSDQASIRISKDPHPSKPSEEHSEKPEAFLMELRMSISGSKHAKIENENLPKNDSCNGLESQSPSKDNSADQDTRTAPALSLMEHMDKIRQLPSKDSISKLKSSALLSQSCPSSPSSARIKEQVKPKYDTIPGRSSELLAKIPASLVTPNAPLRLLERAEVQSSTKSQEEHYPRSLNDLKEAKPTVKLDLSPKLKPAELDLNKPELPQTPKTQSTKSSGSLKRRSSNKGSANGKLSRDSGKSRACAPTISSSAKSRLAPQWLSDIVNISKGKQDIKGFSSRKEVPVYQHPLKDVKIPSVQSQSRGSSKDRRPAISKTSSAESKAQDILKMASKRLVSPSSSVHSAPSISSRRFADISNKHSRVEREDGGPVRLRASRQSNSKGSGRRAESANARLHHSPNQPVDSSSPYMPLKDYSVPKTTSSRLTASNEGLLDACSDNFYPCPNLFSFRKVSNGKRNISVAENENGTPSKLLPIVDDSPPHVLSSSNQGDDKKTLSSPPELNVRNGDLIISEIVEEDADDNGSPVGQSSSALVPVTQDSTSGPNSTQTTSGGNQYVKRTVTSTLSGTQTVTTEGVKSRVMAAREVLSGGPWKGVREVKGAEDKRLTVEEVRDKSGHKISRVVMQSHSSQTGRTLPMHTSPDFPIPAPNYSGVVQNYNFKNHHWSHQPHHVSNTNKSQGGVPVLMNQYQHQQNHQMCSAFKPVDSFNISSSTAISNPRGRASTDLFPSTAFLPTDPVFQAVMRGPLAGGRERRGGAAASENGDSHCVGQSESSSRHQLITADNMERLSMHHRVLQPPGGGSSICVGDWTPETKESPHHQQRQVKNHMRSSIVAWDEGPSPNSNHRVQNNRPTTPDLDHYKSGDLLYPEEPQHDDAAGDDFINLGKLSIDQDVDHVDGEAGDQRREVHREETRESVEMENGSMVHKMSSTTTLQTCSNSSLKTPAVQPVTIAHTTHQAAVTRTRVPPGGYSTKLW
ncbi:unnamed protein product [Notodromas monacha]|uniref:Uncharacterized protein n=1 Tax=Notodromas monacha TaxID=399045 RepID=A0A7R9BRM5_9CRUS|nr:unnamed protein product [Notodromas monacha]CAG0919497.1 unnamed protein product [Notodromas monacha]